MSSVSQSRWPVALLPHSTSTSSLAVRALLLAATLAFPGCLLQSKELTRTRRAFERQYPAAHFDRRITLDLGPLAMAMGAGLARRWAPEAFEAAGPYLRYTRRVEVGVYDVADLPPLDQVDPARLPAALREGGWETVVRVREPEEHVWVLARPGRRTPGAFYVLVLKKNQLVATRVEGRLDKIVEHALEKHSALLSGKAFGHDAKAEDDPSDEAKPVAKTDETAPPAGAHLP